MPHQHNDIRQIFIFILCFFIFNSPTLFAQSIFLIKNPFTPFSQSIETHHSKKNHSLHNMLAYHLVSPPSKKNNLFNSHQSNTLFSNNIPSENRVYDNLSHSWLAILTSHLVTNNTEVNKSYNLKGLIGYKPEHAINTTFFAGCRMLYSYQSHEDTLGINIKSLGPMAGFTIAL